MVTLVLLCLAVFQSDGPPAADAELTRKVRQAAKLDAELQKDFTYLERRRDVRISKLGKVTIGPLRTFEVYPSNQPGRTYKRLIEVDGKALTAEELARREAEHERDVREAAERERRETAQERADRLNKLKEEDQERQAILNDAFAVFAATIVGRETIDGEPVIVADVKPQPNANVTTREGRWMKSFEGRVWIAEHTSQIVKLDMQATRDVTIGWGVIGRVHKGSRLFLTRRKIHNVWLPSELTYQASGRTLLFRPFQFAVTTTYSQYKRMTKP